MNASTKAYIDGRFEEIEGYIELVDDKLVAIARQKATLSEMVEVLGGYVNTGLSALQRHLTDEHGSSAE